MSMTTIVVGKMYNGKVHEFEQKASKGKESQDRSMFRGRLNYRDRTNGEYYWIDAVCWKDFGATDGLVGFMNKYFTAENGPKESGGQPIEVVGFIRPKIAQHTAKINIKKGGKVQVLEVPKTSHPTFEFVIESADFVPSTEPTAKKSDSEPVDFDAIDGEDDDFEIVGGAVDSTKDKTDTSSKEEDSDDSLFDN